MPPSQPGSPLPRLTPGSATPWVGSHAKYLILKADRIMATHRTFHLYGSGTARAQASHDDDDLHAPPQLRWLRCRPFGGDGGVVIYVLSRADWHRVPLALIRLIPKLARGGLREGGQWTRFGLEFGPLGRCCEDTSGF